MRMIRSARPATEGSCATRMMVRPRVRRSSSSTSGMAGSGQSLGVAGRQVMLGFRRGRGRTAPPEEPRVSGRRGERDGGRPVQQCRQPRVLRLLSCGDRGALRRGIHRGAWTHDEVQALFSGELIGRRKLFAAEFRRALPDIMALRHAADYGVTLVSQAKARRAVRSCRRFVQRVLDTPV